jgi:radical SAM superfamily enzyme YgiQ (UPF0313 family)
MRVLLVSANRAEINMTVVPFGMACVAEAMKAAGHQVRMLDLMAEPEPYGALERTVGEFRPEVIGVSLRNIDDQVSVNPRLLFEEDQKIIALCKRISPAPVVLGGAGYSIFPRAALDRSGADFGIQGEGEAVLVRLLERISCGGSADGLPGLFVKGQASQSKREFARDLDRFPLPEPALFTDRISGRDDFWFPVQTRRGCPNGCNYCSTAAISGSRIRKRSPRAVVEWMARLVRSGVRQFDFVDNTFNLPRTYAKKLCHELIRAGLGAKWRCILYPHRVDEELAALMAGAGCVEASVGFESGSTVILKLMNKRFTPEEVRRVCGLLRTYAIRRFGFLLLGGPGETRETVRQSLAFADFLDLDLLKITIGIRIYPDTPLAARAVEEGIIAPEDDLLCPRFYFAPGLEAWLRETVSQWAASRPKWIMDR